MVVLCPYCGKTQANAKRCKSCKGLFGSLNRQAMQVAMGPWFVRSHSQPFHPGCSFETLKHQIEAGKVVPTTVLRGPSTRQFWVFAREVPGVSHLLGYCHVCGAQVHPTDQACPSCSMEFVEPNERDALGLMYPTVQEADLAQQAIDREAALRSDGQPQVDLAPISTRSSNHAAAWFMLAMNLLLLTAIGLFVANSEFRDTVTALMTPAGSEHIRVSSLQRKDSSDSPTHGADTAFQTGTRETVASQPKEVVSVKLKSVSQSARLTDDKAGTAKTSDQTDIPANPKTDRTSQSVDQPSGPSGDDPKSGQSTFFGVPVD